MLIGAIDFSFNDPEMDESLSIKKITISTGVMERPVMIIEATQQPDTEVKITTETHWTITCDQVVWEGYFTIIDSTNPTQGGKFTLTGYLVPKDCALNKRSCYYESLDEGICSCLAGLPAPDFSTAIAFYNQSGELNLDYAYTLAIKDSAGMLPGYSVTEFRMVDYASGSEVFDMSDLGGMAQDGGSKTARSLQEFKVTSDTYDVKSSSDYTYGTIREQMNVSIVGSEYYAAHMAESVNKQILEEIKNALNTTINDFAIAQIGDVVEYPTDGITKDRYLILGARWTFEAGSNSTTYKLIPIE